MKAFVELPITQGRVTLIDASDFDYVNQWKWCVTGKGYVIRRLKVHEKQPGDSSIAYLHRVIMLPPKGMNVDHINGVKLDNRRCNLRNCTPAQNRQNIARKSGSVSMYKGVFWNKRASIWVSELTCNYEKKWLGCFKQEEDAARAYDAAAIKYFGEFARLNFPIREEAS